MRYAFGIDEVGRAARKRASLAPRYIIGIDEVGRGPLAGPVVVCAVALPAALAQKGAMRSHSTNKISLLRDSKKLTPKQRETWYAHLTKHPKISYAVARVYPRQIEKRNISQAANLAAHRAFTRLTAHYKLPTTNSKVFLDGGLYLKNKKHSTAFGARTVVKGDEKIPAIAAASIIAKVTRDRFMARLAKRYPKYGFEIHKGYGTRVHLAAIRRLGPSPIHRKTFIS